MKSRFLFLLFLFYAEISYSQFGLIVSKNISNDGKVLMWSTGRQVYILRCEPPYIIEKDTSLHCNDSWYWDNTDGKIECYSATLTQDGKYLFYRNGPTIVKTSLLNKKETIVDTFRIKNAGGFDRIINTDYSGDKVLFYTATKTEGVLEKKYFCLNTKTRKQLPLTQINSFSYYTDQLLTPDYFYVKSDGTLMIPNRCSGSEWQKKNDFYLSARFNEDSLEIPEKINLPAGFEIIDVSVNSNKILLRKNTDPENKNVYSYFVSEDINGQWLEPVLVVQNLNLITKTKDNPIFYNGKTIKISPDGNTIVYIGSEKNNSQIKDACLYKYSDGKWTGPENIFTIPTFIYNEIVISDSSFAIFSFQQYNQNEHIDTWHFNNVILYNFNNSKSQTIVVDSLNKYPGGKTEFANDFGNTDFKPKNISLTPFGKKTAVNIFSFSVHKFISLFNGLSLGIVQKFGRMNGVSIGFVNKMQHTQGIPVGILFNKTQTSKGVMIGLINIANESFDGAQIGLINICPYYGNGVQIGLFNYCEDDEFIPVQIGALNYVYDEGCPFILIPGINPFGLFMR